MRRILLFAILSLSLSCSKSDNNGKEINIKDNYGTDVKMEAELYKLVMEYRASKGLSEIALSDNLTKVAQLHVKDLAENHPDKGGCNLHSWSDKGNWTPVCYTPDHKNSRLMFSKPSELTNYKANGYEIAAMNSRMSAKNFLEQWKNSPAHNETIVNKGLWERMQWKAIGVGIYKGYAVIWFGDQEDK